MTNYSEYLRIFNSNALPCNFREFSIKFRCYLLQNNIVFAYHNKRDIQAFIKVIGQYDLQACKSTLQLNDDEFDDDKIYGNTLPKTPTKKINVIISAYNAQNYIEDCLNSIQKQTYPVKRILIGVDGCSKTLKILSKIKHNYSNLHVYYSEENQGPYMMFNALIQLVNPNDYIQIFGADDMMNSNMLEEMSTYEKPVVSKHCGVLFIQKNKFARVGGFMPWRCGADMDLIYRLRLAGVYISHAPLLYHCREHPDQLTKAISTNMESDLRKSYIKLSEDNKVSENPIIIIQPICSNIVKI